MKQSRLATAIASLFLTTACGEVQFPWDKKNSSPTPQGLPAPNGEATDYEHNRWPRNMVVLGDSIATGLLGGTRMGGDIPAEYFKYLMHGITGYAGASLDLKGLGEVEKPYYSPFTGSHIAGSLQSRLSEISPQFTSFNPSVPGATSWEITQQIEKAIQNQYDFDFTVMEFGHNDFCNPNSSIAIFKNYYERHMARILGINPKARILAMPLMHIPTLYTMAPDTATAIRATLGFTLGTTSCKKIRDEIENACPTFAARKNEFSEWSGVVAEVAATYQRNFPNARIVVANELGAPGLITPDKIALDCFHPNRGGYETIANKLWESIQNSHLFAK
jgi:lysophospholipase L1-like esterase